MSFYKQFEDIKAEIKSLYLETPEPFMVTSSFGKDSSLMLVLLWEALLTIPKEQLTKPVYVVSSDTLVELDSISSYISKSLDMVQEQAARVGLPIKTFKIIPKLKDRYFFNVLGKGLPPVTASSKRFRWCTSKLKQRGVERIIKEIQQSAPIGIGRDYDMYLFLGTREDESILRKNSMKKFAIDGAKFGRHSTNDRICTYYPIKYLKNDDVFSYLFDYETLPWGMPVSTLLEFYPDGVMECAIKASSQENACGSTRNGCWTCTMITEDNMLLDEIRKGNTSAYYLNEYKKLLATIRNDLRYRESIRRIEHNRVNKRIIQKSENGNQCNMFELLGDEEQRNDNYQSFQRASDTDYSVGSLTFEARKLLLEHLLYLENITNLKLLEKEELEAIIHLWKEEGYHFDKVEPKPFHYDGPIVVDQNFCLKDKETTNPNPRYWVTREFDCGRDEIIKYIREQEQTTGKSFYYTLNHWDMGIEEEFVYNIANFLVSQEGVNSEEEAAEVIDQWLYREPKGWTWESYSKEMLLPI